MSVSIAPRVEEIEGGCKRWQPVMAPPMPAIERLFDLLNRDGVEYCHWKGNWSLGQALAGEKDLDVFVDRQSLVKATGALMALGCKPAIAKREPAIPGVIHYYGLDEQQGSLIHVHLYTRIVSGESFIPSHIFPWERLLLEQRRVEGKVQVPARQAELVLFVLRTFIRYGSVLDLAQIIRKPEKIRAESSWLMKGGSRSESLQLLDAYCPEIGRRIFGECLQSLARRDGLLKRVRLARRLRRRVQAYAMSRRIGAYLQAFWGELYRLATKRKNKVLQPGGAVIAFVGPEASGKSTLIAECQRWLGSELDVRAVHAGKPPASWLTRPLRLCLPSLRRLLPGLRPSRRFARESGSGNSSAPAIGVGSVLCAVRLLLLAWARKRLIISARRWAAAGSIVLCDRYPSDSGGIDSWRLIEHPGARGLGPAIHNLLARAEHRIYAQMPPPDVAVRLSVPLERAKARNRARVKADKEGDAYLEVRHREYQDWHMPGVRRILEIDTDQPLGETLGKLKRLMWQSI